MEYLDFVEQKKLEAERVGFEADASQYGKLYPFQEDIVTWALRRGRACIFADCGLGKTPMQLKWAEQVNQHTADPILILAPLAVSEQTAREGDKFNVPVTVCESQGDVSEGVNITNYEKLHHFDAERFGGIVLDESSILKSYDGKTKQAIIGFAGPINYRLACTATPAPNDYTELLTHAEFLDIMTRKEMLATFFVQDGNTTTAWRLKGHAEGAFWGWVATWCVALRDPSDVGYEAGAFDLPELDVQSETVESGWKPDGMLFKAEATSLDQQREARNASLDDRVETTAQMVNQSDEPWIVWCGLNKESRALTRAIPDAVEVSGSDSAAAKEEKMLQFSEGEVRVIVTKPSIAGHGMNWQHCSKQVFVGMSHSYESFYQAVRRSWRFGQDEDVTVYMVTADANRRIIQNIKSKESKARKMMDEIVQRMMDSGQALNKRAGRNEMEYERDVAKGDGWRLDLGDCVEVTKEMEDDSIGLSVFSPPFPGMYVYSNSKRDMGNVKSLDQMVDHFRYLAEPLREKTMPGRSCVIHLTQVLAKQKYDGYIGLKDFRGRVIEMMQNQGWQLYGEVTIDKDPQVKAVRTKDSGLQFKSLAKDAARMHQAMADYLLQFRAPGDNPEPIEAGVSEKYDNEDGWITNEEWIRWARPVWYASDWCPEGHEGISETNTLNAHAAREEDDERHLAPLQLGVLERCIKLWSNPGDTVFDPFAGIGSTPYMAVRLNRKGRGAELKGSYFELAKKYLRQAETEQNSLFSQNGTAESHA
jgi:DNA modification methylase/superfamily II DNA or RNA helicase